MSLETWQPVVGFALAIGLEVLAVPILKVAKTQTALISPSPRLESEWHLVIAGDEGGKIIGRLERAFYFGAFWLRADLMVAAFCC